MSLTMLAQGVYWFAGAVNSLVVASGQQALLIDTGLDDSHARKLLRAVEEAGLIPSAILNTHSHADHHGGNRFILKKYPQLPVYAPPLEAAIINHPLLEPLSLYGAHPPPELRGKFILAPASPAQPLEAGIHTLGGVQVELLEVPGHASQMYAVRVGQVLYAADALFGPESLEKHPLTFCVDSAAMKRSAAYLAQLSGVTVTVVGHGQPSHNLSELAQHNLRAFEHITALLRQSLEAQTAASSLDDLLAALCSRLNISMTTPAALLLNRSALAAHLGELLEQGEAQSVVTDNRLSYQRAAAK